MTCAVGAVAVVVGHGSQSGQRPPANTADTKARRTATTSSRLTSPPVAAPAVVELHWPGVRKADFYNLVLLRGEKRIDLWPTRNRLALTAGMSSPTGRRVTRGRYTWFVYAGFRDGREVDFGRPLAQGTVRLPSP